MMMTKSASSIFSLILYFITIIPFFSYFSPFYAWLMMEINALVFLYMAYATNSVKNLDFFDHDNYFMYFKIQSLASFFFLGSIFFYSLAEFSSMESSVLNFISVVTVSSIAAKMGMPPFHQWPYKFCSSQLSAVCLFIFLTFQKFILFGIMISFHSLVSIFYALIGLVSGSMLVFSSSSLLDLMVSSSIFNSFWFITFFMFSLEGLILFLFFYSLSTWYFSLFSKKYTEMYNEAYTLGVSIMSLMVMALPPFSTFFLKSILLVSFAGYFSVFELLVISSFLFLGLCSYLKFFHTMYSYKFMVYDSNFSIGYYSLIPVLVYFFFFF